eukprot:12905687-Prorocentrum_lima.AAC.1
MEEFTPLQDHAFALTLHFPPSTAEDQTPSTMKEVGGQVGRVKPGMAIYPDPWKNQKGELADSCYWEIDLLSGYPFFLLTSRIGGVKHLGGRISGPVMSYHRGIVNQVVAVLKAQST